MSGYAMGAGGVRHRAWPLGRRLQHPDLCAGWRTGGTMLVGHRAERLPVPTCTGPEAARAHAPRTTRSRGTRCRPMLRARHAPPPPSRPNTCGRRARRRTCSSATCTSPRGRLSDLDCARVHRERRRGRGRRSRSRASGAEARVLPWLECNPAASSAGAAGRGEARRRSAARACAASSRGTRPAPT